MNQQPRPAMPDLAPKAAAPKTKRQHPTAMISARSAAAGLRVALQVAAWALIVLSVVGTFYGLRGARAPLAVFWTIPAAMVAAWPMALAALVAQGLLALVQWGGRAMANTDKRWWIAYLISLSLSAYWNWSAFGAPMIALGVPWLLALGIVLAGDIFPELTLVQE